MSDLIVTDAETVAEVRAIFDRLGIHYTIGGNA